jgi:cell division protein FtsI/penicillin-binding protein 2
MKLLVALLAAGTLYNQSVSRILEQRFGDPAISYLLIETKSGEVVASRWEHADAPVPLGSLLKPFTALAYGAEHRWEFPKLRCKPSECWLNRSHGELDISRAIALSCNSYFHQLSMDSDVAAEYLQHAGLRTGSPLELARAYRAVISQPSIRAGMALSAKSGTAKALGSGVLAKTGTSACTHHPHAPGDGFVVAMYPATAPRYTLMVRLHGAPGAKAAEVAAQMLKELK